MGLKLLKFQSIWMLRELDRYSQGQFVFIALLGFLVFDGLGLWNVAIRHQAERRHTRTTTNPYTEAGTMLTLQSTDFGEFQCGFIPDLGIDGDLNFVGAQ